jgi:predicted aminopeptidase
MRRAGLHFALLLCLPLTGCYVLQAANGQWDVMARRQPIARVVSDPSTPEPVKTQLERVITIREFAVRELALPDNGSYRSYADVGRQYVVWNVFATPEFSVEPRRWCFPVAGCVAYRGYFSEVKARKFAARLAREDYDVYVGGVPAYSTLGHFDDPVLNTMLGWSDVQLAAIIFHELAHQLLYVPSDSSFNEAFASIVEDEGVRRWLEQSGRVADLGVFRERRRRHLELVGLFERTRGRLRQLYAEDLPPEQMRVRKQAVIAELRDDYEARRGPGHLHLAFDSWFEQGLNNAHLVSVATYQDCVPGLRALLTEAGDDLPAFYARVRELVGKENAARREQLCRATRETQARRAASRYSSSRPLLDFAPRY